MGKFDSIILNGKSLRPAPFVSTVYEYAKYNNFILGGTLVVTLSGTLVDEKIVDKVEEINNLQANSNCLTLTIGCGETGGKDFLDGSGRIRSVDVSYDNQPFVATYTIVVAIETINGQPAVKPDPGFAKSLGIQEGSVPLFLAGYSETLTIDGSADIIGSHDGEMSISKASIKGGGSIKIKVPGNNFVCGYPSVNLINQIKNFLDARSAAIINGLGSPNPFSIYTSWEKWLDTRSLEIATNGNVTWKFDLYMIKRGGFTPKALVDINTNDRMDQKTLKKTRSLSGTIKGLSLASIDDHLNHKVNINERIGNAQSIFDLLDQQFLNKGTWPGGNNPTLTGDNNCPVPPNICVAPPNPVCYQRSSHSVTKSPISGELSFTMEFQDIDSCSAQDFTLDITIDENFPANNIQEIIIPNRTLRPGHLYPRSIIQTINPTAHTVTITIRANLKGCDSSRLTNMIETVCCKLNDIVNTEFSSLAGWFYRDQSENAGLYSYTVTHKRAKCDLYI